MTVAIRNPKEIYRPNDVFEGEITLVNNERDKQGNVKPANVKSVQIQFFEHVAVASNELGTYTVFLDESHEEVKGKQVGRSLDINTWKDVELGAEPVTLPFSVQVPGGYHSNLGRQPAPYNKDWFVGVSILQKTGMIPIPNFVRIFPVDGSDRTSNLLNSVRIIGEETANAHPSSAPVQSYSPPVAAPVQAAAPEPAKKGGMFGKFNIGGAIGGLKIGIGTPAAQPAAAPTSIPMAGVPPVRVRGTTRRRGADYAGKISMTVAIKDPKPVYRPGDVLEGEITLVNNQREKNGEVKPTTVKSVDVYFWEHVPVAEKELGTFQINLDYVEGDAMVGKPLGRGITVDAWKGTELGAAPITLPFSVQVPGGWHSNLGRQPVPYNKDWFVAIAINQKTGMVGTPGFSRIFPVDGSDREADLFNDVAILGEMAPAQPQPGMVQMTSYAEPAVPAPVQATAPEPAKKGGMFGKINIGGAIGGFGKSLKIGIGTPAAQPAQASIPVASAPPVRVRGTTRRRGADYGGKISMSVAFRDPKPVYRPGDVLEGEITLVNNQREKNGEVKPTTVKSVDVYFWEHVPVAEKELGTFQINLDYVEGDAVVGKPIGRGITLDAWKGTELGAAPVTLPFSVQVPGGWHSNLGRQPVPYNKDWFVAIAINQKTGMVGTPGFSRIFPVDGSDRESDLFNDVNILTGAPTSPESLIAQEMAPSIPVPAVVQAPAVFSEIENREIQQAPAVQEALTPQFVQAMPEAPVVQEPLAPQIVQAMPEIPVIQEPLAPQIAQAMPEIPLVQEPLAPQIAQDIPEAPAVEDLMAILSLNPPAIPSAPVTEIATQAPFFEAPPQSAEPVTFAPAPPMEASQNPPVTPIAAPAALFEEIPPVTIVPSPPEARVLAPAPVVPIPEVVPSPPRAKPVAIAPRPPVEAAPVPSLSFPPMEQVPAQVEPPKKGKKTGPIDYHEECLNTWGKWVPIPVDEIARKFGLTLSNVMKLINIWIKENVPLKYDGFENTLTLAG